ncbi:MAG: nucleotidyltransferase family protein [Methylovulum sp.]|nr:nucleotidyltransferase family protein [Methylovulum sp.]
MKITSPLLVSAFIHPERIIQLDLSQWDLLIRQARRAGVLARLSCFLENNKTLSLVPEQPLNHLKSAKIYADQFEKSLVWEVQCIRQSLSQHNIPVILLKGAAYIVTNSLVSKGRIFSDVDILVDENQLANAEFSLRVNGWMPGQLDLYDQKYYRQWMHEIPPLTHVERQSSIDVHYNILPKVSKFCPDANKLLANIVMVPEKNIWVLAPEDRVLHSATHLFHEGELEHGFRDLSDLDLLLKELSMEDGFWIKLLDRAVELNQQTPLFYALRYSSLILQTPVPAEVLKASEGHTTPNRIKQKLMDALFLRALMPDHQSCNDQWTGLARWLLFIRSHWLRMPWYLLIPHLLRKSWLRLTGKSHH